MSFQLNLRSVVYSLSDALDLVGVDEIHHGKRVAYMALECARHLDMGDEEMDNLFHAAILHDCGVSSTHEFQNITGDMVWEGAQRHCNRGYKLLKDCPPLVPDRKP